MAKKREQFLFEWRRAVASSGGPAKGPTRHVLLTLSLHMDQDGGSCYPSTRLLEEETGITRKTVERHLREADGEWIERIERSGEGRSWKRFEYRARYPDGWSPPPPQSDDGGGVGGTPPQPSSRSPTSPEGGVARTPPSTDQVESEVPHLNEEGGVRRTPPQDRDVEYDVPHPNADGGVRGTPPAEMAGGVIHDLRWSNSRPEVEYDVPLRASLGRQEDVVTPLSNPPASSGDTLRGDEPGEAGRQEIDRSSEVDLGTHPVLSARWKDELREAVLGTWHDGHLSIDVPGEDEPVGMGIEYQVADDLFHLEDDPAFVRWLVVEAPPIMGWDSEPRSLKWARRPENLEAARSEYLRRAESDGDPVDGLVDYERLKPPQVSHEDLEAEKARLR